MGTDKSSVAGIVDPYGGLRIVVAPRSTFKHHVAEGELLFIVPNVAVREPVPYHKWPWLERVTRKHIDWWIKTRNDPDDIEKGPVKLYRLRCLRTYQQGTVDLTKVVET